MEKSITTTNARSAAEITNFKQQLATQYMSAIQNYLGDKKRALKFLSATMQSVQKNPALLNCSRSSLMTAFMACAEYNLYPSNVAGECFVIPYKDSAQFQLGYLGLVTLMYRAGAQSVNSILIHKNDVFNYEEGLEPKLEHVPVRLGEDRGDVIGVYAIAVINNQKIFKVMSIDDVMKFKKFSKSAKSEYSPWNQENDPEGWMIKKTCIKQLAKLLPKNETIIKAVEADDSQFTVIDMPVSSKKEAKETAATFTDSELSDADKKQIEEDEKQEALQQKLSDAEKK